MVVLSKISQCLTFLNMTVSVIRWIVGLALLVGSSAQTCDDVDLQVCQGFAAKTNVCTDQCLSKLCPRTCNLCPFKCYHCEGISSPGLCNTTQICADRNYSCIVTETLGSDFSISYRQGCATKDVCTRLFGSGIPALIGKRSNLNGECCENDLCNNNQPIKKRQIDFPTTMRPRTTTPVFATFTSTPPTTTPPMMTTEMTTPAIPVTSPICDDVDQASCQRLATIKRDMCNDDCIVKKCPRTCGKCAECYSCSHVEDPANCTNHAVCEPGEKCYVLKTLSFSGEQGFKMGCMLESVCKQFNTQASNVFGKRNDPVELSVDGDCCTGDLCNHVALAHGTSTFTTMSPTAGIGCTYTSANHHCPTNFHLVDGKCLMVGPIQSTYSYAQSYCNNHCSILIENFSNRDASAISYFVRTQLLGRSNYVYIGAQDTNHNGHYTWNQAGTEVAHATSGPVSGRYCLTYSATTSGVHPVTCSSHHYFLCQAQLH